MTETVGTAQHYLPRLIMGNFAVRSKKKTRQVYVFDKTQDRHGRCIPKPSSIANFAQETGFYDFKVGDEITSLDPSLADLETMSGPVIRKVIDEANLSALDNHERSVLATFLSVQFLRTLTLRSQIRDFDAAIKARIAAMGQDPENVRGYKPLIDENAVKATSVRLIVERSAELAQLIYSRSWVLIENRTSLRFWLGDDPVTLHNEVDDGAWAGGFAAPGSEISMPLSPTLYLWMPHVGMIERIKRENREAMRLYQVLYSSGVFGRAVIGDQVYKAKQNVDRSMAFAQKLLAASASGRAMPEDNVELVEHFNFRQLRRCSRFVFSQRPDLELAKTMIARIPEIREPIYQIG